MFDWHEASGGGQESPNKSPLLYRGGTETTRETGELFRALKPDLELNIFLSLHMGNLLFNVFKAPCSCSCSFAQSCLTLCDPMDCCLPGSSMKLSRQEHWSG